MQALIFPDIGTKSLGSNATGSSFSWPKIPAGDDIRLKLRLIETVGGEKITSRREISAMKLSVGKQDARPTSGAFQLKLGPDAESAGVNTTTEIALDATAEQFAAALNALTDAALDDAQPFTVAKRSDSWHVRAADDSEIAVSVADNSLLPQSLVSIRDYQHDEATHYEFRLIQTVVAEQTNFAEIVPELPSVTVVLVGGTSSGILWNTVQEIFFPPELGDGYSFRIKWGFRRTAAIVLPTDASTIQTALDAISEDGEELIVSAGTDRVLIEFRGDTLAGTSVAALEIESIVTPRADAIINLSTATDGMAKYMAALPNAATGITEFKLPLALTLWLVDEQDEEETEEITFIQEVTFQKPVSMAAFSAAATLNPTKPLSRTSYQAFSPTQVVETQRGYLLTGATALGDGMATEFQVDHNLGTRHVYVSLFESAVDGAQLVLGTDYDVEIVSDNAIKITFGAAPDEDSVVGGVCTVASTNAFVDLEIEISQVNGLEARLTALEESVALLNESAAVQSGGTRDPAAGAVIMEQTFRKFAEMYPAAVALDPSTESIAAIDQTKLSGDYDLLGAIHDASVEALTTPPTPSSANKGRVYQNRTADEIRINGGGGRKSYKVQPGEFCGSDGRRLYPLVLPGFENRLYEFTSDVSGDILTIPGFAPFDGMEVYLFTTGTLPAGLSAGPLYLINSAGSTCQIYTAPFFGVIDITDAGTGTHTMMISSGASTSFFPRDFEREIFIARVSGNALQVKKTMEAKVGFETAILNTSTPATRNSRKITQAQWRFVIEIGVVEEESAPATTKTNIKRIAWQATPIVDELIHLTRDTAATHTFGARIKRTGADAWTVEKNMLGFWTASSATLDVADFFIRARLTEFDVEDHADPEGVVILLGPDRTTPGDTSNIGKLIVK